MSTSRRLRVKIELAGGQWRAACSAFWSHPRLADRFTEYLVMTHGIIRASVPLMQAARDRARAMGSADGVASPLAEYLDEHIPEEADHDDWMADDLIRLGVARDTLAARIPSPTIAALVGQQYYWIYHVHPVALLGYIAVLEGSPPAPDALERLVTRTGLPKAAFRTLFEHADLDEGHYAELERVIDDLPLDQTIESLIGISAIRTVQLAGVALAELADREDVPPVPPVEAVSGRDRAVSTR